MQPLEDVLPAWQPKDLHLLIANFLRVRFPILLGLNKVQRACAYGRGVLAACGWGRARVGWGPKWGRARVGQGPGEAGPG